MTIRVTYKGKHMTMTETTETPFQQRDADRRRRFAPEVAKARASERSRRHAEAQRRANVVLRDRHNDEWRDLYEAERAGLDADRGPLPGDEDVQG